MQTFKKLVVFNFLLILILTIFLGTTSFAGNNDISTYSPSVILMEASTGKIIYEKNSKSQMPMASTTKIMTAILTLEHCQLTDVATASHDAVFTVPVGYSHANILVGEELTIDQLLHVLLIPSANDAANVLAEHIAGSISSFATMMNTKAKEIGCLDTNFVNPSGIQADNHYSTAYDMAIMGRYAMNFDTFREIVSTTRYTLPSTNKYPETNRYFRTTNELLRETNRTVVTDGEEIDNYYYEYSTGIKTGYTDAAKDCIVASAKKDNKEFILAILGAKKTENRLSSRFLDCKNLFNYAFENYSTHNIHKEDSILKQIKISNATNATKNLNIVVENDITVVAKRDTNISSITPTIEINSDLKAPITKNSIIGKISYTVDGNEYSSNLLAGFDVIKSNAFTTFLTVASILLVLYILSKLISKKNKRKKKKYKKKKSKKKTTKKYNNNDNYLKWI